MSEIEEGPDSKAVLGIHSNTEPGAPLIEGHAWLTLTRDGKTQAYGLWPADHPRFSKEIAPPATDIREGIENGFESTASRYYELTPDQLRAFEAATREKVEWGYTNTCASWASDTAYRVTGERVNASELGGITDTPRQLRESIDQLEREHGTSRETPREPDPAGPQNSSGSGSLSRADGDHDAGQVERVLAAAGDPERLRLAMDDLAASARGQAFSAEAAAHAATLTSAERSLQTSEPAQGEAGGGHLPRV